MPAVIDAVVLAGGGARRLGGADKPGLLIGGVSLLDRVLAAVPADSFVVVVGPGRPVRREVRWCREEPAGSGPVAALAAALPHVAGELVLVLAADLPTIGNAVDRLSAALDGTAADCAVLVTDGRRNYLAALWRRPALAAALAAVATPAGAAMRQLYETADVRDVIDTAGAGRDVDTWPDVESARAALRTTTEETP